MTTKALALTTKAPIDADFKLVASKKQNVGLATC